jgi:hypothetical protein
MKFVALLVFLQLVAASALAWESDIDKRDRAIQDKLQAKQNACRRFVPLKRAEDKVLKEGESGLDRQSATLELELARKHYDSALEDYEQKYPGEKLDCRYGERSFNRKAASAALPRYGLRKAKGPVDDVLTIFGK